MYRLKPGVKQNPQRRWALPDRVFFGHGACHILAGVYLLRPPLPGFHAERIIPSDGHGGNHIYVTDGRVAFDYRGYSLRNRLLLYHTTGWSARHSAGWACRIETVDFDLLDQADLNARKMLGLDQYYRDPRPRAQAFIGRVDHRAAWARAGKRSSGQAGG